MGDNAPRMLGARKSQGRNSFSSSISFGDAATPSPKTKGSHVKVLMLPLPLPCIFSLSTHAGILFSHLPFTILPICALLTINFLTEKIIWSAFLRLCSAAFSTGFG
jgi:hypothetical protein